MDAKLPILAGDSDLCHHHEHRRRQLVCGMVQFGHSHKKKPTNMRVYLITTHSSRFSIRRHCGASSIRGSGGGSGQRRSSAVQERKLLKKSSQHCGSCSRH